jgi:hypothetical protein
MLKIGLAVLLLALTLTRADASTSRGGRYWGSHGSAHWGGRYENTHTGNHYRSR